MTRSDNTNRESAIQTLIASLKQRFPDRGFRISQEFLSFGWCGPHYGMGAVAKCDIPQDTILLVVPESTRFSVSKTTYRHWDVLKHLCRKITTRCEQLFPEMNLAQEVVLAVRAMYLFAQPKPQQQSESVSLFQLTQLQAATWPSLQEMKDSSIYYLDDDDDDDDNSSWMDSVGKNALSEGIKARHEMLRKLFQNVLSPILEEAGSIERFCLPNTTLWETFRYAFSVVDSRAHGVSEPALIPLVEMFNGGLEDDPQSTNVALVKGKWPFLKGKAFRDDCNLPCSAVYAQKDIRQGEPLIVSYGNLCPSEFVIKYGAVPQSVMVQPDMVDRVNLFCPPELVPTEGGLRAQALEVHGFPLPDLKAGKYALTVLDPESLGSCRRYNESDDVKSMRQFLILGHLASDAEVQLNLNTGRLRVANLAARDLGQLLCRVLDYNLDLLCGESSQRDMERAVQQGPGKSSSIQAALLRGRVCQRETLLQWRHFFAQQYHVMRVDYDDTAAGCRVCGRSYPKLTCTRCKWTGTLVHYCSRQHQRMDWKNHKPQCCAVGSLEASLLDEYRRDINS